LHVRRGRNSRRELVNRKQRKPPMSENHEEAIAREIRKALDQLTRELKLTRIAFAAVTERIEAIIDQDICEFSPGYTSTRSKMN